MRLSHPGLDDPEFYVPGLPVDYVAARYGVSGAAIAKLGSAENPLGASPLAVQAIRERLDDLHLYPSWTAEPLREKVSQVYGFEPERVMCGAGETEIMAAFANGAAAHAFELDDVHEEAVNHPGAVVVPAALAVAEDLDASGLAFLEAVVIGYEAMSRAGLAVGPVSHMLAGFHPTSMSGVFGAAAAAAHLRGLDAAGLNHAFGIAASLASGTMEFASSGGMAKRIHAARAAEGGLMAASLAAEGFEGAGDGLAGPSTPPTPGSRAPGWRST